MVSFSCEVCNDTVKKNKLDQHAQRCRGAYYTCIDCSTTFNGTEYRSHTSCISEAEKYEKALYKGKAKQEAKTPVPAKVQEPKDSTSKESKKETEKNVKSKDAKKDVKTKKELADISKLSDGSLYKIVKAISKDSKMDKKKVMEKLQVKVADGKLVITL